MAEAVAALLAVLVFFVLLVLVVQAFIWLRMVRVVAIRDEAKHGIIRAAQMLLLLATSSV